MGGLDREGWYVCVCVCVQRSVHRSATKKRRDRSGCFYRLSQTWWVRGQIGRWKIPTRVTEHLYLWSIGILVASITFLAFSFCGRSFYSPTKTNATCVKDRKYARSLFLALLQRKWESPVISPPRRRRRRHIHPDQARTTVATRKIGKPF